MLDRHCVVEVKGTSEGSGYLIAPDLILTAWHVIKPKAGQPRAAEFRVRILGEYADGGGEEPAPRIATILWPPASVDPADDFDFALLRTATTAAAERTSYIKPPQVALLEVRAIGFPDAGIIRRVTKTGTVAERDTWQIDGKVSTGTGAKQNDILKTGKFKIMIDPSQLPTASHQAWHGMSGAAVFAGEHLVGIITDAEKAPNTHWLPSLPVDRLLGNAAVQQAVASAGLELPLPASNRAAAQAAQLNLDRALPFLDRRKFTVQIRRVVNKWLFAQLDNSQPGAVREPLFLALAARADDDVEQTLVERIDRYERTYFGDPRVPILVKPIAWADAAWDIDSGQQHLEDQLRNQIITDQLHRNRPLTPEKVKTHLPANAVLILCSTIPLRALSATDKALLAWWQEFCTAATKAGVFVLSLIVFERPAGTRDCCSRPREACQRSKHEPPSLPEGLDPSWQPLTIIEEDIDKTVIADWFKGTDGTQKALLEIDPQVRDRVLLELEHVDQKILPRSIRCIRHSLPLILKEVAR